MAGVAAAVAPSDESSPIYRFIFWLVMAVVFFGGMYWAVDAGFFG
jgi:hypothetical protein